MIPQVKILSDEEVRLMHARALDILAKVGIKYESRRALDLLAEHGQKVDHDKGIAWIQPDLVERCLKTTPRVITLAGRDPKHDLLTDGKRLKVTTNGQGTFTRTTRRGCAAREPCRTCATRPRSATTSRSSTSSGRWSCRSTCPVRA